MFDTIATMKAMQAMGYTPTLVSMPSDARVGELRALIGNRHDSDFVFPTPDRNQLDLFSTLNREAALKLANDAIASIGSISELALSLTTQSITVMERNA